MGACFTGSCVGAQVQIEQSPDLKRTCGCPTRDGSPDWEMIVNALPWPRIEQKVRLTPVEQETIPAVRVSELEAKATDRA